MAQIKTNLQYGVTGSLQTGSIAGDAIDGTKIADDAINSEHLAAGGIDTAHIANSQITNALMADNAIGLAEMAGGTDGNVITYDASGNPAVVSTGTSGHFLKSQGAGSVPVFAAAGGDYVRIAHDFTTSDSSGFDFDGAFDGTTYQHYRLVGFTAPATNGANLHFQWRVGGSGSRSTYTTANYWYLKSARSVNESASQADAHGGARNDAQFVLAENCKDVLNANSAYATFDLMIADPDTSTMSRGWITGTVSWHHQTDNKLICSSFGARNDANVDATGLHIGFSTGDISYGRAVLYGYKYA